jgi:DNA topoisomerase I
MAQAKRLDLVHADPARVADAADLVYLTDAVPGFRRKRQGRGFTYLAPDGAVAREPDQRRRFAQLAIPPAWTDVWIAPDPSGHIQATGRDDLGRKQYIYHPRWAEIRNRTKFDRMILFAEALPTIRAQVEQDLRRQRPTFEKVLALVIRLLDRTKIRIGNPEYAAQHDSFGLTTLLDEHVTFSGHTLTFDFTGKSGKQQHVVVKDRRLARLVGQCQELPGQQLFQYRDADGCLQPVRSGDVNDYLRQVTGDLFTAKDFRTWGGTVAATATLEQIGPCTTEKEVKAGLKAAVHAAAADLGNTVTVCRQYYVHPAVLESYAAGQLCEFLAQIRAAHIPEPHGLDPVEAGVFQLLVAAQRRSGR